MVDIRANGWYQYSSRAVHDAAAAVPSANLKQTRFRRLARALTLLLVPLALMKGMFVFTACHNLLHLYYADIVEAAAFALLLLLVDTCVLKPMQLSQMTLATKAGYMILLCALCTLAALGVGNATTDMEVASCSYRVGFTNKEPCTSQRSDPFQVCSLSSAIITIKVRKRMIHQSAFLVDLLASIVWIIIAPTSFAAAFELVTTLGLRCRKVVEVEHQADASSILLRQPQFYPLHEYEQYMVNLYANLPPPPAYEQCAVNSGPGTTRITNAGHYSV